MRRKCGGDPPLRPYFDNSGAYGNSLTVMILKEGEGGMLKMIPDRRRTSAFLPAAVIFVTAAACATVKVQAPDKPIEINLNVNIKQEVLIKMDKEIEDLISNNPDIF